MATAMATATATTTDRARYVCQMVFWMVFWVWATFGFLADDVFKPLQQVRSALMWTLDATMVVMALAVVRRKAWLLGIAAFVALTWVVTCVINRESTLFWVNGMREFVGLLLVYPVMLFIMDYDTSRSHFLDSFDRQGLYFLIVQALCIVIQLAMYGAGDLVGGGFGHFYSGQVSVAIYLVSFLLIRRRIDYDHFLYSLGQNKVYIILLLPTFLNETKVSFVMLVLYFLLLVPVDRKLLQRWAVVMHLVAIVPWLAVTFYSYTTRNNLEGNRFGSTQELMAYFMLDDIEKAEGDARWNIENNRGIADVPRLTKLMYLAVLNQQEPGHVLAGFGVGHFKGGTQIVASQFARDYDWLLMGSVPYVFHIYIQLGLLGLLLLQLYWVALALYRPQWASARDEGLQLMLLAVVLIIYFYNDMLRNLAFCMIFFTLLAASWRPPRHVTAPSASPSSAPSCRPPCHSSAVATKS